MRTHDQPVPAVTLEAHALPYWWQGHGQLVVALERLPQAAYVWDDDDPAIVWDDPTLVWDAPFIGSGFTDVWCDLVSLELVTGEPDEVYSFRTPYARLTIRDPGDGRYRARTVDGRLLYWAPGRRMAVWWHDETGEDHWLFSGQIATWRDDLLTPDVTVEAYGSLGGLAQPLGRDWTAGAAGEFLAQRVAAILAVGGLFTGPHRSDLGDVNLTVPAASDTPPLDELRRAARSDGGIVFTDADDTVVVRDRRWRNGRDDQDTVPMFTANVCWAGPDAVVAWDVIAADLDVRLASVVSLVNQAGLAAVAANPGVPGGLIHAHPDPDLWTTQAQGDALAAHLAAVRADARLAIGNADVHLHDVRFDYWHQTLERRLGDHVRFIHEDMWAPPGTPSTYDVTLVVTTMRHQIARDAWTVQLATTPAIAYTLVELWDVTALTWDDPNPLAVWR